MHITCDRQILSEAVSIVSRAVSGKSTIPALEGILLRAENDRLYLTGYDLELGISTSVQVSVKQSGQIVLPAKLFADMLRMMPAKEITIKIGEKLLALITGGAAEYNILGIAADTFPELPGVYEASGFQMTQGILKSMIQQTIFAVSTTDSKPVHMGSLFDMEKGALSVVSVDGYRLALRRESFQSELDMRFVVPAKTLSELSKLMRDDDEQVEIGVSRKHIIFTAGGFHMISRLLDGEFLDYKNAIPKMGSTVIRVNTRSFIESVERTSLLISDRLKSPLRVEFKNDAIRISCMTPVGRASDELDCAIQGSPLEIGFNSKYLIDALKASDSDEVRLEVSGPLSPMKIMPPEGDAFVFLVLPVRLRTEE